MTRSPLMTVEEVAELLRRSTKTIRRRIGAGAIEAIKEGGRYLISRQAFDKYVTNLESPGMDRTPQGAPRVDNADQG